MTAGSIDRPDLHKLADTATPLHPLLAQRWSPRGLDPQSTVTEEQLTALFEAARWAPSWGNTQPARYLVGYRGDVTFEAISATLSRGNRWANAASVLIIGVARTYDEEGEPFPYGEYGLGLATENLVLQAVAEGLVAHQMAGFDPDAARASFNVPTEFSPTVAIAVGTRGELGSLPEKLQHKEVAPRERKPLGELVFRDSWGEPAF